MTEFTREPEPIGKPIEPAPVKPTPIKTLEKQELVCRRWPLAKDMLGLHGGTGEPGGNTFIRCDMETVDEMGTLGKLVPVRKPIIARLVPEWASRGNLAARTGALAGDAMIVRINTNHLPARLPVGCEVWQADMGKLNDAKFISLLRTTLATKGEHAAQNLLKGTDFELGDYEELVPRITDKASGNASILYPTPYSTYDFGTNHNPLSLDNTNWSYSTFNQAKANGGKWERTTTDAGHYPYYRRLVDPPSADYGVKMLITPSGTPTTLRLDVRHEKADTLNQNSYAYYVTSSLTRVYDFDGGATGTLAGSSDTSSGYTSMRFEVAGQNPNIALYPYKNEVEIGALVVTGETAHDAAGHGILGSRNSTATTYDDFQILVAAAAGGGGPFRTGPFRSGPFRRGAFR